MSIDTWLMGLLLLGVALALRALDKLSAAVKELQLDAAVERAESRQACREAKHLAIRQHGTVHTDDLRS